MAVTMAVPPSVAFALCQKVTVAPDALWQCTAVLVAVYTGRGGDHHEAAALDHG
jgi:hypothetical protein